MYERKVWLCVARIDGWEVRSREIRWEGHGRSEGHASMLVNRQKGIDQRMCKVLSTGWDKRLEKGVRQKERSHTLL